MQLPNCVKRQDKTTFGPNQTWKVTLILELFAKNSLRANKLLGMVPVIVFLGVWIALAWGTASLFLSVISITFVDIRGWSEGNAGLPYLALGLRCFFGFGAGLVQDHFYTRNKEQNGGKALLEARLNSACLGGPLFPIGIIIYAWTDPFIWVNYWGCLIGLFLIIISIYAIFLGTYNYTSDAYILMWPRLPLLLKDYYETLLQP